MKYNEKKIFKDEFGCIYGVQELIHLHTLSPLSMCGTNISNDIDFQRFPACFLFTDTPSWAPTHRNALDHHTRCE